MEIQNVFFIYVSFMHTKGCGHCLCQTVLSQTDKSGANREQRMHRGSIYWKKINSVLLMEVVITDHFICRHIDLFKCFPLIFSCLVHDSNVRIMVLVCVCVSLQKSHETLKAKKQISTESVLVMLFLWELKFNEKPSQCEQKAKHYRKVIREKGWVVIWMRM